MPQWNFRWKNTKHPSESVKPPLDTFSSGLLARALSGSGFLSSKKNASSGTAEALRDEAAGSKLGRSSTRRAISKAKKQLLSFWKQRHERHRSRDRRDDPLGLTVLHKPETESRTVDILFIHGLGGTSLRTWCKNRELEFLWPRNWLPQEANFSTARIMTFGYNAHFSARKERNVLTINDFAADLLFNMKYDSVESGEKMGEVPIIVVAHSMGGLVFKRAYAQGTSKKEYRELMSSIKSVLFLATPHKGTNLAETLNRVLSSSIFGHAPRKYVAELTRDSFTINEINDSFSLHASKLRIFSFYETHITQIGPMNILVVEENSSMMGYDNETVKPLDADHHGVCKFSGPEDPNYRAVRNALQDAIASIQVLPASPSQVLPVSEGGDESELDTLRKWLGATGSEEDDLAALRSVRKQGTCEDLLKAPDFEDWLTAAQPYILWAHAAPGNGKTVQCSFVVDFLRSQSRCVHWFFRHGDVERQLSANMFRSVAYQIARQDPIFRGSLIEQAKSGTQVLGADAAAVWRIVFAPRLSIISEDLFWVVDAPDESDYIGRVVDLTANTCQASNKIRMLFFTRPPSKISYVLGKARKRVRIVEVGLGDNLGDIRLVVTDDLKRFPVTDEFRQLIIDEIMAQSQGSFLWTSLVLERILQCYRSEDVQRALRDVPDGMEKLYDPMAKRVTKLELDNQKRLCRIILSWVTYGVRPLTIKELEGAYAGEFVSFVGLDHLISQLSGEFVRIDQNNQLALVHQSAREYLRTTDKLGFILEPSEVNKELFATCLKFLGHLSQNKTHQRESPPFTLYSSVFWSDHLDCCSTECDDVLEMLFSFFNGDHPPFWIHALSHNGQLSILVKASSSLKRFVRKRRKGDRLKPQPLQRLPELALLDRWAVDLLKLTAKFGNYISHDPATIFTCIPSVSPENSILFQKFSKKATSTISVTGLSNVDWDDCVARISSAKGSANFIAVSGEHLAVAINLSGRRSKIRLWDSVIFKERIGFPVDEPVFAVNLSRNGQLLACYGQDNTWVWDICTQNIVVKLASPLQERAMALEFAPDDSYLVVATDSKNVYKLYLKRERQVWVTFGPDLLDETYMPEGAFANTPSFVAFNEDCTQLAIAYRNFPLAVWNINPPKMLARCRRKTRQGHTPAVSWSGVNRVAWHPHNGQLLGIYRTGYIFKWGPVDNTHVEIEEEHHATPYDIRISRNGKIFCTSNRAGRIQIYDYSQMVLIYRFESDDVINAIILGPDSERIYGLGGFYGSNSYCYVWEPRCLLASGIAGQLEDSESIYNPESELSGSSVSDQGADEGDLQNACLINHASEAQVEIRSAITSVATCPYNQQLVAYANRQGTVVVYDIEREVRQSVIHTGIVVDSTSCLILSLRGDHIAYATDHGCVHVQRLRAPQENDKAKAVCVYSGPTLSHRFSYGSIKQLLLNSTAEKLFICGKKQHQFIRIADGAVIAAVDVNEADSMARWENHFTDTDTLLAFTATNVRAYSWETLALKCTIPLDFTASADNILPGASPLTMKALLPSYHPRFHLAVMEYKASNEFHTVFILFDTLTLNSPACKGEGIIRSVQMSPAITRDLDRPLGILPDGRLAFLDKDTWVCTADLLSSRDSKVKRHFFLPPDWLTSAGQLLCRIQADGTILCPSRGEMAVVKSEIGSDW